MYSQKQVLIVSAMSVLFSISVLLANLGLFDDINARADGAPDEFFNSLSCMLVFLAGISVSYNSIILAARYLRCFRWNPVLEPGEMGHYGPGEKGQFQVGIKGPK